MSNDTQTSKTSKKIHRSELPSVSVVIPAFNCATHIRSCLAAVAAQTYQGSFDVTVAVAPSSDATEQVLAKAASELTPTLPVHVIENPSMTASAGLNAAIAHSSGRIVVRVDAQSRLPPGYIERAVATMIRTGAANVGGIQRPVTATCDASTCGTSTCGASRSAGLKTMNATVDSSHAYFTASPPARPGLKTMNATVDSSGVTATSSTATYDANSNAGKDSNGNNTGGGVAASIAVALASSFGGGPAAYRQSRSEGPVDTVYLGVFNRDILCDIGGFDESLDRNQDYELNWRLRQAGHIVWLDPSLVVDYTPRDNYRDLAIQYFHYGAWKRTVLSRNPKSLRLRQLAPPVLLITLAISAIELYRGHLRGAIAPLLYASTCFSAVVGFRSELPDVKDRWRAGIACVVIHMSWATGFLTGKTCLKRRTVG